jgi:hypothetical protein
MAKTTRGGSRKILKMPAVTVPHHDVENLTTPTHAEIAARAYALYCERGFCEGRDFDDWLDAERELRLLASTAA